MSSAHSLDESKAFNKPYRERAKEVSLPLWSKKSNLFTVEVLTLRGLVTFYVLFFIRLEIRGVEVAGITSHPHEAWMMQIARNVTMDEWGFLDECRYLLHERDTKYTHAFREIIKSSGIEPLRLPPRSPNLNAHAERWYDR